MKSYEIYKCRRQALGLTREQLAEKANLDVKLIEYYEDGKRVSSYVKDQITKTLVHEFQDMDSVTHYKRRILELALELNQEIVSEYALREIGHMMVEAGKLQMAIINDGKI